MSRLNELINELCPDGVKYKAICKVAKVERGKRVVRKELSIDSGYPVYQNSLVPMGFHTDTNYPAEMSFVIGAGAAGEIGYSSESFWAADDCFPIVCGDLLDDRYLYHVLLWKKDFLLSRVRKASIPRLSRKVIEDVVIPVPPMEVQREIVRILDSFTLLTAELTAKLTAELTARQQQYKYYSKYLLCHAEGAVDTPIEELGKWQGGKTPSMANPDYWNNGSIPWISSKDMKVAVLEDTQDHITNEAISNGGMKLLPAGVTAIVTRSGILKHTFPVAYVPVPCTINQDIKALIVKEDVDSRFAALAIQAFSDDIRVATKKQGGTVDSLEFGKILSFKIPVPPLDEQLRVVQALDRFDSICNDIASGIPAEIEARQKQYEYYRDKLLTFKEKEA